MPKSVPKNPNPGFVVLRRTDRGVWESLGEIDRERGVPGREARTRAVLAASGGRAKPGEVYAAVPRSEWMLALDWEPVGSYQPRAKRGGARG